MEEGFGESGECKGRLVGRVRGNMRVLATKSISERSAEM